MNNRRNRRARRAGFTLMEVLLVLAILVILGSMVGFFIAGMQKSAYEDLARSQIGMFEGQLDAFRLHVGSYPTTNQGLQALRTPPADLRNLNKRIPGKPDVMVEGIILVQDDVGALEIEGKPLVMVMVDPRPVTAKAAVPQIIAAADSGNPPFIQMRNPGCRLDA